MRTLALFAFAAFAFSLLVGRIELWWTRKAAQRRHEETGNNPSSLPEEPGPEGQALTIGPDAIPCWAILRIPPRGLCRLVPGENGVQAHLVGQILTGWNVCLGGTREPARRDEVPRGGVLWELRR